MNELISVVIPSYNRKNTILSCIRSVLEQTYSNLEVIVIDDGSTDYTYTLFNDSFDDRVKFFRYEENRGACYARNLGAELSSGAYIAFQDSDDIWKKTKLAKELSYLKKENADMVFCGMNRKDPIHKTSKYYPDETFRSDRNILAQLLENNAVSTQTILIKREVINKIKFDVSFKRYQDWDFALQAASSGIKIAYLAEGLVDSTIQGNSISANVKEGVAYEHLIEKHMDLYNKNPRALAAIYKKIGNSYRNSNRKKSRYFFKMSLKTQFHLKVFVKWIVGR